MMINYRLCLSNQSIILEILSKNRKNKNYAIKFIHDLIIYIIVYFIFSLNRYLFLINICNYFKELNC